MSYGFDFYVKGIEDGMVAALAARAGSYVTAVLPYRGELDAEEVGREHLKALSRIVNQLPLYLVSYADGEDELDGGRAPLWPDQPRELIHRCSFVVVACALDARGERGVGTYRMIADAHAALIGRQFLALVGGEPVPLNLDPLRPSEPPTVRTLMRRNEMTAHAIYFDTQFAHSAAADLTGPPVEIHDIQIVVDALGPLGGRAVREPGVHGV
ncbi:MAG: DUF1834 family protein [Chloroflexi bacterium]|nr:DUF1834 family protein [Chloroflexota bacterium]